MMIPQNGLMMPHGRNIPLSAAEEEALEVRFPKLSIKQRKFAVNPGYMSYYNPDFEVIEDERDMIGINIFVNLLHNLHLRNLSLHITPICF